MQSGQIQSSFYEKAEHLLTEQVQLAEFYEAINDALVLEADLPTVLQKCVEIVVEHTTSAFGRIWTLDDSETVLQLQASAGLHTRLDGTYSRIPVGKFKIGLIAAERIPHLTNKLLADPRVADKEWVIRNGLVSFAGYPLVVEDRLVGVMCVFARNPLSGLTLRTMASIAKAVASGIERKQTDLARRNVLEKLEEARDGERRRLSRQLHDEVAQQLVIASIRLSRIEKKLIALYPENNSLVADIVAAQELILRNHQALRQMAHVLHSGILEHFGLPAALGKFVSDIDAISNGEGVVISFEASPNFPRLRPATEIGIYRIVQEAATNALKHAHAKNIRLGLSCIDNLVRVVVEDDGSGFDSNNLPSVGIGFASMRERAEIIDAKLTVSSTPGIGTSLIVELTRDPEAV